MVYSSSTEAIETLAAEIGENIYMDIAKWHLYLSNAKLHTVLAERLYPMLADNQLEENKVLAVLQDIPVKLGGGAAGITLGGSVADALSNRVDGFARGMSAETLGRYSLRKNRL